MREFVFNNRKFEISEYGDLYRCAYEDIRPHKYGNKTVMLHRSNKRKEIKCYVDKNGYAQVILKANGKSKHFAIHQLVYMVYCLNIIDVTSGKYGYDFNLKNYIQINHKDGNKLNNYFSNLELVSLKENIDHAVINKLHNSQIKAKYVEIYKNEILIKTVWKTREASKWLYENYGVYVNCGTISRKARNGKSYKGFTFKYKV